MWFHFAGGAALARLQVVVVLMVVCVWCQLRVVVVVATEVVNFVFAAFQES